MKHYLQWISDTMAANWQSGAITDFESGLTYSYGQLAEQVERLTILFEELGVKPGDKISICGRNSSHWGITFLTTLAYRGVAVSILPDFTSDSIHELVNHSESKLLFVGPWVKGRIDVTKMPDISAVVSLEDFSSLYGPNVDKATIDHIFAQRYPSGFQASDVHYYTENLDELALINYTSGSTGSPKGVMLTHRSLTANVEYGQAHIPNHPGQTIVSILPLAHMFGMMFEFLYQLAGGTHIYFLTRSLTPTMLLKAFKDVKPYMILTVPLVIEKIFKKSIFPAIQKQPVKTLWKMPLLNKIVRKKVYDKLMEAFGGKLEILIIGGAALNGDVEACLKQLNFPFTCGYGMTECGPLVCYVNWKKYVPKSCGKSVTHLELRINSDNPLEQEGEILVRGAGVMLGYYKNPEATGDAFLEGGWLRTGDVGVIDREGNVFLRGRIKSLILGASGQNIYPEEIEDKLNSMDGVLESLIVDRDGKLVGLVFPDTTEDMEKLKQVMHENLQKLNALLPNFSKVSDIEMVDKEFEKTPKKSIKRFLYK